MLVRNTRSLIENSVATNVVTTADGFHFNDKRDAPRRIALKNLKLGITLYIDLEASVSLGRENPSCADMPHVDLEPYHAHTLGVSRSHAVLNLDNGQVYIIDNNSTNGVWLNQELLRPLVPYRVNHGDIIRLASMAFQIRFPNNAFGDLTR